jgi:SAM-dependent methyltransferase
MALSLSIGAGVSREQCRSAGNACLDVSPALEREAAVSLATGPADTRRRPARLRVRRRGRVRADDGAMERAGGAPVHELVGTCLQGLEWLDDGCGDGSFTQALVLHQRPATVVGVDPAPAQLSYARRRVADARVRFLEGDAQNLPLPDACVDAAVDGSGALLRAGPAARRARDGAGGQGRRNDRGLPMGPGRWWIPAAADPRCGACRWLPVASAPERVGSGAAGIGRPVAKTPDWWTCSRASSR